MFNTHLRVFAYVVDRHRLNAYFMPSIDYIPDSHYPIIHRPMLHYRLLNIPRGGLGDIRFQEKIVSLGNGSKHIWVQFPKAIFDRNPLRKDFWTETFCARFLKITYMGSNTLIPA
jgi:hypothetical protein